MSATQHPLARDLQHVIAHTDGLWDEMRRQSVFVTGGTGFIGRWMLESLLWANDLLGLQAHVMVLSRRPGAFALTAPHLAGHPAVTLLEGDVRSFAYPDGKFSHVLHLAKESDPTQDAVPRPASFATSAAGMERVLAFAASHGTTKLLFTSSGAVYGRQPVGCERLKEDYVGTLPPEDPKAGYALGKRAAESLCRAAAEESDVRAKIARCFTFVGPYMDFEAGYAIGNFIRDSICRDALEVNGDGTPLRSYLYAADLAVWLWTILFVGDKATPYNVGSPDAISIADLAGLVARVSGGGKAVHIAKSSPPRSALPARYIPDTSRATSQLGLKVEIGLEEAVRRTARWYRATRCREAQP
jgi:dTDP-glucose 4,6-dehydratase